MTILPIAACLAIDPASASGAEDPAAAVTDEQLYEAWRTLRQFDCARCHGATFEGSVGPSLPKSAEERGPELFKRLLLEGNIERGMPAYQSIERVAKQADAIYAYFKALAEGRIPVQPPKPAPKAAE